jgi:outer membrane protein OmpA-like peptidoglycan-associated protein
VSDPKKIPGPPPDDFSETTPNINLPAHARGDTEDAWGKPESGTPRQPPSDDWGNTVNIPGESNDYDFSKTYMPKEKAPPPADWGMTQANIDVSQADFGTRPDDYGTGGGGGFDKTTPYFRLPEAERTKYQDIPPTPAEEAAKKEQEQREKGGVPTWVWVSGGLMSMFFFALLVLLVVYFFILGDRGYDATVKGAPPGSDILVDGAFWGVTNEDGSKILPSLKAGETKRIEIKHPNFTCEPREIKGVDGVNPEPIIARCQAVAVKPGEDCTNIRLGEFDKAERCYNAALDALPDPFTVEDLLKALNILIINFESGKYDIPPVRLAAIQKGAGYIKKMPSSVVIEVGGHTDNVGSDASNQTLSENRAKAVRDQLIKFGVDGNMLQTKGYGEMNPKTTNETEEGRFHNRRIQYSLVRK